MKKIFGKLLALALVLTLSVSVLGVVPVLADETDMVIDSAYYDNDYEPYNYHRVVKDKCKTFSEGDGCVVATCFYERIVLVGFKKGIKKINKTLKKLSNNYYYDDLYECAEAASKDGGLKDVFCDYVTSDVTWADQTYISVVTTGQWYAGGSSSHSISGYVFNLDTGKKVSITTATGSTLKQVKKALLHAIKEDVEFSDVYDSYATELEAFVNGLKTADISYYINGEGKAVVCVGPYTEPFYGGWTREYVLNDLPAVFEVGVG